MDYYMAQISLFPYGYAPRGWMLCDGRTLAIQSNAALYSLIGTRFGGDGSSNFKVPDLRSVSPVQLDKNQVLCAYYICCQGLYPVRP